jgi:hypothetical protein
MKLKTRLPWMLAVVLLPSCMLQDEDNEAEKYGIHQTGQEDALSGTWKGTLAGFSFSIRFDDGDVVENWMSGGGMTIHTYEDNGIIGYYSFDGSAFHAVIWDSIRSLDGALSDGELVGKDGDGDAFRLSR